MKALATTLPLLASCFLAHGTQANFESPRYPGPHGLTGWTVSAITPGVENQGLLPLELVIARNRHIVRRLKGSPFVWKWDFQHNGRWVAYEAGPLHFSMACYLVDIQSGRQLAVYDCYTNDFNALSTPAWVRQLDRDGNPWNPGTSH